MIKQTVVFLAVLASLSMSNLLADDTLDRLETFLLNCEELERFQVAIRLDRASFSGDQVSAATVYSMLASVSGPSQISRMDAYLNQAGVAIEEHVLESNKFRISHLTGGSNRLATVTTEYKDKIVPKVGANMLLRRFDPMFLPLSSASSYTLETTRMNFRILTEGTLVRESESDGNMTAWIVHKNRKAGFKLLFAKEPNWLPISVTFVSGPVCNLTSPDELLNAMSNWDPYAKTETKWIEQDSVFVPHVVDMEYNDSKTMRESSSRLVFLNWKVGQEVSDDLFDRGGFEEKKFGNLISVDELVRLLDKEFDLISKQSNQKK